MTLMRENERTRKRERFNESEQRVEEGGANGKIFELIKTNANE
jgi:hypothetical protein